MFDFVVVCIVEDVVVEIDFGCGVVFDYQDLVVVDVEMMVVELVYVFGCQFGGQVGCGVQYYEIVVCVLYFGEVEFYCVIIVGFLYWNWGWC